MLDWQILNMVSADSEEAHTLEEVSIASMSHVFVVLAGSDSPVCSAQRGRCMDFLQFDPNFLALNTQLHVGSEIGTLWAY